MAKSTFFYHLKGLSDPIKRLEEKAVIRHLFNLNKGRYGYRRITIEMRKQGYIINHKTVVKFLEELGLKCMVRMKKYRSFKGDIGKTAPNLLQRNFKTEQPKQKLATDITEFSLFGQKLYLSPIIDLFNGEIISYHTMDRPVFELVDTMLNRVLPLIPEGKGIILHSDQGWHYRMKQYRHKLEDNGILQSMSRKGNCLDNAVIENFFGILKTELLYLQKFESMEHFKQELHDYIYYYNNHRIKSKLNGLSPVEFRKQFYLKSA